MCNKCNGNCNSCNCTCNDKCTDLDCACSVFLTTDCVTSKEDLACSNILKGQTLTEVIKQLDAYICERFISVENFLQLINVGEGYEIYKGTSVLGKKEIRTLVDGNLINIVQGTDEITISVDEEALSLLIEQDNFVRQLIINVNDLPVDYTEQDICDYILALPSGERTILETDSKWNVIIESASS